MEPLKLRFQLRELLSKHGIDDLLLEIEIIRLIGTLEPKLERSEEDIKRDTVAALLASVDNSHVRTVIKTVIENQLRMNPYSTHKGEAFVEFAFIRQTIYKEDIETFVRWWIKTYPDPKYWSFEHMKEMWPRAFGKVIPSDNIDIEDKWQGTFTPAPKEEHDKTGTK